MGSANGTLDDGQNRRRRHGVPMETKGRWPRLRPFLWALFGGILGAGLTLLIQNGEFRLLPTSMKYEDLAAVLLSAVGVIVAVFGVGLAILAFWGFGQLKADAIKAAISNAERQVDELIREEIKSPEMENRIRNRVDEILLGSSKDKELDTDPENQGDEGA